MQLPIPASIIERLGHDLITQLKPSELVSLALDAFKKEVSLLQGDADHDGTVDAVEIGADLAVIEQKAVHIAQVLEAAQQAKK